MTDFSYRFRKIVMRYTRIDYNLNVMRQSACLVINPIKVDGYAAFILVGRDQSFRLLLGPPGLN